MIDPAYVQYMARYNRWQNENLYSVADQLTDAERRRERGAFFDSIHKTFSHLLWADRVWMSRFSDTPKPETNIKGSLELYPEWDALKADRATFDGIIIGWADRIDQSWLDDDLRWYSGAAHREMTRAKWRLVAHFFNHQTHHRGQIHGMLTQAGGKPHDTDLMLMPE